jgi:DNA-binding XRE family transcriptional regulator
LLATPLRYYSPRFLQATAGWMYGPVENPDGRLMRLGLRRATLSEVRRAVGLTQKQLAQTLGMERGDLAKLERRQNLHVATLTRFIEATGGRRRITAVYGDTEVALDINGVVPSRVTDVRA